MKWWIIPLYKMYSHWIYAKRKVITNFEINYIFVTQFMMLVNQSRYINEYNFGIKVISTNFLFKLKSESLECAELEVLDDLDESFRSLLSSLLLALMSLLFLSSSLSHHHHSCHHCHHCHHHCGCCQCCCCCSGFSWNDCSHFSPLN